MSDKQDLTFEERILSNAFDEMLREMRRVGVESPDGAVLDDLEGMVLDRGRDILRRALQTQLQAAVEASEKKSQVATNVIRPNGTRGPAKGSC